MRFLVVIAAIFISFSPQLTLAQLDINSLTAPDIAIEIEPEFPRPGEKITATINDYGGGVYGSSITWVLDGQVIPEAENQRSATLTAGAAGSAQAIEAVLTKPTGGKEILRKIIRPIYLDIIIEPQTRTPAWYLGRSLPSIGSVVNATALVSAGAGVRNPDLVYTWQVNRKVIEGGAIRGRNQISFATPMGDSAILSLQVTELNGTVLARRAIFIPIVNPSVAFYEVNSLYGMKQHTIKDSLTITGNSATVQAEPYNLDLRVYNNPDIHEWEINGKNAGNVGSNPYEVTMQRVGTQGVSKLNFHVRDMEQILQGAQNSVQINF